MATFPTSVAGDSDLYIAVNNKVTNLSAGISSSDMTIPVASTTGFPSVGYITIDNEIIHYTSVGASQFNADVRGADGTSAVLHLIGVQVNHNVIAAHHNVCKDEIKAIEQFISDLIGRVNTHIQAPVGSAAAPSYTFAGATDIGLYWIGSSDLGISTGGVAQFHFAGSNFATVGTNTTGQMLSSAGSATAPSFGFNVIGSNQTGLYLISTDRIGITVGGVSKYQFNGSNFGVVGTNTTGQFLGSAGTVSLPSFAFNVTGSGDTGLYLIATDNIGISCGGVKQISIDTSNFTIAGRAQVQDGTAASPALQFTNDPNTGLYSIGADSMGIATNGTLRFSISATAITSALPLAMGTNKITGLTAGTAAGDAVNVGQLLYRQAPIQGTKTTSFSTTSTSYVATGLTATITPTSSASRIKVTVSVPGFDSSNSTLGFAYMTVARNTTDLSNGNGFANSASGSTLQFISNVGFCYIDSPASTSATVYEVYIKIDNALVTARLNGLTGTCTIILEEIA